MNKRVCYLLVALTGLIYLTTCAGALENKTLHLYLDADLNHSFTSSRAIEQGILTALSQVNNRLDGHLVKLIKLDHRGNSRRSLENLKAVLKDDRALAVFGGLHSPPLLANLKFINENRVLHLIPWAAAGPITRYKGGQNWVFRLSIDDSKAGEVLVNAAIKQHQAKFPALVLEETGWGRSNAKTMNAALAKRGMNHAGIFWFKWGTRDNSARIIIRRIIQSGADSILLVANAPEGKTLVKAMAGFPEEERLPIVSHWGITGGDFTSIVTGQIREQIQLSFLQTRYSFLSDPVSLLGQQVFEQARLLFAGEIEIPGDIKAPTGFIHAYDLTKILIAAVQQAGLTKDIEKDRARVRDALENLEKPVPGLIKTYRLPFSSFDADHPDGHEALSMEDLVMGLYDEKGNIVLMP